MATWNFSAVSDAVIAFKKGITLQQGRALRDNPIAIAEAATGAPVVEATWHATDSTTVGSGDGLIYDGGTVASVETPVLEAGYDYRLIGDALTPASGGGVPSLGFRVLGGSYTVKDLEVSTSAQFGFDLVIGSPMTTKKFCMASGGSIIQGGDGAPIGVGAFNFSGGQVDRLRFEFVTANITAGKIWLLQRKIEGI